MPTFFVQNAGELVSRDKICHFDIGRKEVHLSKGWIPQKRPVSVALTCGASCPDVVIEGVLQRLLSFFPDVTPIDRVLDPYPLHEIEESS
jgi:4-hydroxy-3-methylbut-2-enyl diphosphate reductase